MAFETTAAVRQHAHKRVKMRLRIYFTLSVVLLGFVVYTSIVHSVSAWLVVPGLLVGVLIGIIVSRMYKLSWDENSGKVISRIDVYGFIVLAIYVLVEVFRSKIVGRFVEAGAVTAVSFAVLSGIMYGRVLGMRGVIVRILKEEGIFTDAN